MNPFSSTLKEISQRLDLPQPARSRVILEIAADLQDLHEHYREQGLPDDDAHRQALEHCDLSEASISELVKVHASGYRRLLDRFSAQAQTRWERLTIGAIVLFVGVVAGRFVLSARLFEVANPAVWLALAVTFFAITRCIPKFYSAYLRQDHDSRRLRAGLPAILSLAGINLLIGLYGPSLELYTLARRAAIDTTSLLVDLTGWLMSSSALLIVCLLAAVLIALCWFILANKIARIEQDEAALLFLE